MLAPAQGGLDFEHSVATTVPVDPSLARIGRRLAGRVILGTASWNFPGWRGLVYGEDADATRLSREGLESYAVHPLLNGVSIDRSYYAPLSEQAAAAYASQTPEHFRFMVKAPRDLTTWRGSGGPRAGEEATAGAPGALLDPEWARDAFLAPLCAGLGDRLGLVMFQFPPSRTDAFGGAQQFARLLRGFLEALPTGPLYGVEVRNRHWLTPAYVEALTATGAVHCLSVHPALPDLHTQMKLTAPALRRALVVRWNLGHGRSYEAARARYAPFNRIVDADPRSRDQIARLCARAVTAGVPAYVTVNNKAEGSAPLSIELLARQIEARLPEDAGDQDALD